VSVSACDRCLRRGRALELLAGHLETERARIDELLACPDEALVEAVAGERAGELRRTLARFDADEQRARVAAAGLDVICRCSVAYPRELLGLRAPPAALYLTGPPRRLASLAAGPTVAIVGARRASSYGIETARSLAFELAGAGVTIVSGLALGIDGAAHAGALEAARGGAAATGSGAEPGGAEATGSGARPVGAGATGSGARPGGAATTGSGMEAGGAVVTPDADHVGCVTIAVLAGGAERPYPASHRRLYTRIRNAGLVVSELPPGVRPRRWMFPARNRIIAALSTITVVIQARPRSGALVTARHAAQLRRHVGAVPGQVNSPLSAGPHGLIRDGAELITDAQDVLDLLYGPGERSVVDARRAQLAPADAALLDALDEGHEGPAAFVRAGLEPVQGLEAIAALELAGLVKRSPGGRLTVTGPRPR
jgi:DNA processing protein